MQFIETQDINFYYVTTKEDLDKLSKILETKDTLYCDTETYPLYNIYGDKADWRDCYTSRIRLFQVNFKDNFTPYVIDIIKIGVKNCQSLVNLLLNENIRKVFHNSKFDCKMIRSSLGIWAKNVWCTLICSQRINVCTGFRAGQMRGNSLKALARDYLGINLDKTEQTSDWSNPNLSIEQLSYAALDVGSPKSSELDSIVGYLYNLFTNLLYTPAPKGFGSHCKLKDYKEPIEIDQAANSILAKIEYNGMPVSKRMLDLIYSTASKEVEELKLYLCKSFGLPIQQALEYTDEGAKVVTILSEETQKTLNNPKKLVQLVNKTLKKQGIELTDVMSGSLEEALKKLKAKESEEEETNEEYEEFYWKDEGETVEWNIDLIDKLVKYKELSKLVSIDYRKLINPVTGRLHSSYQCIGASTGRMSSGGKGSFNCQQISLKSLFIKYYLSNNPYNKELTYVEDKLVTEKVTMRNAFVVDKPGYVFASADFSAQELRAVAALSKDPNMGKVYKLEKEYLDGTRSKPKHPITGESYDDPLIDLHICAGMSLNTEVRRLVEEEPWNANTSNPLVKEVRNTAKPLNYGLIYGAGAHTVAGQLGSTVEKAQDTIDKYYSPPVGFYGLKEYLDSTAMLGSELRWIQLATGEYIMVNESNSKGIADANSSARRSCNASVQGISATQSKLALIKADKKFEELNKKYELILKGRKAELIAIVHDEIDAVCPGDCSFELVPDNKLNKTDTDCYYKPKATFNNELIEHQIAVEYSNTLKECMQEAMKETFDIVDSNVPALSSVSSSYYWVH